jgi:3-dehydroquinate synthase
MGIGGRRRRRRAAELAQASDLENNSDHLLALESSYLVEAVKVSCQAKAEIVAADERETGQRALLNLGHTFGHAIETACGYGTWLHGETVAMGMVMAADLSVRIGQLDPAAAKRIRSVLEDKFAMAVIPPSEIDVDTYLSLMALDKKTELGKLRFILLKSIGEAVIRADIETEVLKTTLLAGSGLCTNHEELR